MLTPIAGEVAGKEMACQQTWDRHSMGKAAGSSKSFSFLLFPCPDFLSITGLRQYVADLEEAGKGKGKKQHTVSPILPSNFSSLVYFPYEVSAASIPTSAFSVGHS
jgi:hypothetical protein